MCKWSSLRSRKGSSTRAPSHKEEDLMDEHLAELQLLNSAAVVDGVARMNGSFGSGEVDKTKFNGNSAAVVDGVARMNGSFGSGEVDKTKSNGNPAAATAVDTEKMGRDKKTTHVERLARIKHSRHVSDIDSLSPEVLRALQSTFGGKLLEIRSRIQPTTPAAPAAPPTPPPPRLPPPLPTPPSSPPAKPPSPQLPTPPSSPPTKPPSPPLTSPPLSPPTKQPSPPLPSPPLSPPTKQPSPPLPSPPSSPLAKPRSLLLPSLPSSPVAKPPSPLLPSLPSSPPAKPPPPPSPPEKRTFVERLADSKEGANMLVAYFSSIFLSGFILLATDEDDVDGSIYSERDFCRGMGINTGCARLFGYVLPVVVTASFFTFALVFFVFDVSFSLFNILTAAKDFFFETKDMSTLKTFGDGQQDSKGAWTPRPTVAGLVLLFMSDLGFIVVSSALLWISRISTAAPTYTICEWRLRLLWMLGLMVMDVVILLSAVKSFRDPQISDTSIHTAAKRVSIILCVLLACTAVNHAFAPPRSGELGPCLSRRTPLEDHIQMYPEPLQDEPFLPKCAGKEGPELLQCEWRPQSREKVRHLDWCEANQQCDWPQVKQIQLYDRKDVCRIDLPQCDWPVMKQIQLYEDQGRCAVRDLVECEWPWVNQIQLYEQEERCQPRDVTLHLCDWPWSKQIQLFEAQDRCPLKNPNECDWPWVKQIQLFESKESCSSECRKER